MKVNKPLLCAIAASCFAVAVPALASVRELSDCELDEVYAGGFDIDVPSVMAFRAAVEAAASQASALSQAPVRSASSFLQNNIAAVCSTGGDIISATVKNINTVKLKEELAGYAESVQRNLSVIATKEGSIQDSTIQNANALDAAAAAVDFFQENIGVMVAGGDIINCAIDNANQGPAGQSVTVVETCFIDCLHAAKAVQIQVSQSQAQKNVGIFVSRFGTIINSLIRNTHNQD